MVVFIPKNTRMTWLYFALLTVGCWGTYGILLHHGQQEMSTGSPDIARYKSYLFVGIAYFLTAVLMPLLLLMKKGEAFTAYPTSGMWWSLIAGTAGSVGAFGVLLAFGAKGTPPVVMSIIFAGAPIVNAVISLIMHPPAKMDWRFLAGIVIAAAGAFMVVKFKPAPAKGHGPKPPAAVQAASPAPSETPKE